MALLPMEAFSQEDQSQETPLPEVEVVQPPAEPAPAAQHAEFEDLPPLPGAEPGAEATAFPPLPPPQETPERVPSTTDSAPGATAPPLFPGGDADLEHVPVIRPSENAFESPVEQPPAEPPF